MASPTPPPGWYPDPSGAPGQRYWDGQTWSAAMAPPVGTPPAKKSSAGKVVLIVAASVVGIGVLASIGSSGESPPTGSSAETSSSPRSATAQVGQEVRDGEFAFIVNSVYRTNWAGDPSNQFLRETPQGEFINVQLTVRNIGAEAARFSAHNQKLIVGGKMFDAASVLGVPGDGDSINPGLGVKTVVSFDVPVGTTPDAIELHDSMFSGGAQVKLPPPTQGY